MKRDTILFASVNLIQLVDLSLTSYFVFYSKLAIESNPLLQNPFSLILAKLFFISVYTAFYVFKGNQKQFKYVSAGILVFYVVSLTVAVTQLLLNVVL